MPRRADPCFVPSGYALSHPCRDEPTRSQGLVIARNSRLPHFTAIRDTLAGNPWMPPVPGAA
jgi:hypothetical protein